MSEPHDWGQVASGLVGAFVASGLGRAMAHAQMVRGGKRRLIGWHILWEVPTAMAMATIGQGLADYIGIGGNPALGLVAMLSYLGPPALAALFDVALRKWGGIAPPSDTHNS